TQPAAGYLEIEPRLFHPFQLRCVMKPLHTIDAASRPALFIRELWAERSETDFEAAFNQPFRKVQCKRPHTARSVAGQQNPSRTLARNRGHLRVSSCTRVAGRCSCMSLNSSNWLK